VTVLVLAAKAAVAVLLLASGGAKLADLAGFADAIRLFAPVRAPAFVLSAGHYAAVTIAATELLAGAMSLCWPSVAWVNLAVLGLTCAFAVVAGLGYARHRGRPCHCFGALTRRGFGLASLLRAGAILAAAAIACVSLRPAPQLDFSLAFHLLLLAGAAAMAAAATAAAKALLMQPESAGTVA
jgi:hypothetical protein